MWQIVSAPSTAEFVLLGDLSAYVSLSGYRFRLPGAAQDLSSGAKLGESLVVVGMPGEAVEVTYLRKVASKWIVHVQHVAVGSDGRVPVTLK